MLANTPSAYELIKLLTKNNSLVVVVFLFFCFLFFCFLFSRSFLG